jgi:hypothetical protein
VPSAPLPRTIGELLALADRDDADEAPAAPIRATVVARTPEQHQLDGIARDCLEDVGNMSNLRRPFADGDWLDAARFDDRLLANLDALVALGVAEPGAHARIDVVDPLVSYAGELHQGDFGRAFALSFVLGCFEGEASARAAVSAVRRAHPAALPAHADALRLASGDAIGRATNALLLDARAELVELGLDVLAARREASFASVVAHLSHPSSRVVAAAARCLGGVAEREAAAGALAELLDADDDRVFFAVVEALAVLGDPQGLLALRERLSLEAETRGLESDAFVERGLLLLAAIGAATDAALVRALALRGVGHRRALGWFGHPAHVDVLLADLATLASVRPGPAYPSPAEIATVEALHRIVGAELRVPPALVPETVATTDLVRDPEVWAGAWVAVRDRLPRGGRVRFGRPWSGAAVVDELARSGRPGERVQLARELAVATHGASRLDVEGWVEAQLRELGRLREGFDRGAWAVNAGTWLGDR